MSRDTDCFSIYSVISSRIMASRLPKTSSTIARLRTDYVHEQQSRYRTAIADLEQRIPGVSTSERVKLSKKLKKLQEQSTELQTYEEKIHHLADQFISIDLDDGVKKNYEIFKDVLAKIK